MNRKLKYRQIYKTKHKIINVNFFLYLPLLNDLFEKNDKLVNQFSTKLSSRLVDLNISKN